MTSERLTDARDRRSGWIGAAVPCTLAAGFFLLAAAPAAFAAQERLPPDGIGSSGCDWVGCSVAVVDEDPDGPGTDWATAVSNNTSHTGHFTFATPSQPLTAGAGLQEFRASVRRNATCGTGTPTARIELWEAGSVVRAGPEVNVTAANSCVQGTSCQVVNFTWNATEIVAAADVEVLIVATNASGSPSTRCAVDLGAVEWNADVSAGTPVPTLSTPTSPFATIGTGSATLGATIETNGGDTITGYGTVWGTAPAPTGNAASAGTDNPALPHPFFHGVTVAQTPGTLIYFRGYADNGGGRGYSPDGTFYLEPNQATGAAISNVTGGSMQIDWSDPGTGPGDGSIVVMKLGTEVDTGPTDGTPHNASATFGSGEQLGTGNYVVFRGSGNQVTVNGLAPSTTYHVAVYQYAGTAAPTINYQQDGAPVASDTTSAGGALPTLDTPTATAIGSTTATLGATITGDGGDTITEYGTVWGTSPAPTGNELAAGATPPGPPHTFSHARTGLPQATLVYYRGYADNGAGRGYSSDGSFRTEIATQAQTLIVRPTRSVETELDFTWSRGSGEGVIVLMREGTPVDADPVDGTANYTADPTFANGSEIGTGNYVVYIGPAGALTVGGLFADLTYHIAIYEYAGAGAGIDYLQANPARGSSGHNGMHAADCFQCHFGTGSAHGSFQVPVQADQQAACESCHNATGPASAKLNFSIHTGPKYNANIDCGSCHEVHNNYDFTTTDPHTGGVTAANVEWFRVDTTKWVAGALEPALFQANTGFFAWDDDNSPWNGSCQTCHQNTDWHRNDNSLGAGSHAHNSAADCRTCHDHGNSFLGVGGSCLDCHNKQQPTSAPIRRQIVDNVGDSTTGEFGTAFTSHHVNDGTGAQIVTRWDCVVCHAEGDVLTGEFDDAYHQKDGVQLKDVDTGAVYSDWSSLTSFERSSFCLSCHDADGATIIAARPAPPPAEEPDATNDPLNPFNDGVTNAHEPAGLDGTAAPHVRGRCSTTATMPCILDSQCPASETCQLSKVLDVESQFDTSNFSHHAVLGPSYVFASDCLGAGDPHPCCTDVVTGPSCGLPFGTEVNLAIQGARTDLDWNSVVDCEDCHIGPPALGGGSTILTGHGTPNSRYMLRDINGNEQVSTPANDETLVCRRCHDPDGFLGVGNSLYGPHTTGQHMDNSRNLFGIGCLNCHGGGTWGGIHGVEVVVTDDDGAGSYNTNVFTYGSGLDYISNWTEFTDSGVSCSAKANPTLLSNCTQHGSNTYGREPRRNDTAQRIYRAP